MLKTIDKTRFQLEKLKVILKEGHLSFPLGGTLPADLLEQARRRLGLVGLAYAVTWSLYLPFPRLIFQRSLFAHECVPIFISIVMGLGIYALSRSRISSALLLDVGLGFQVAGSFTIALLTTWNIFSPQTFSPAAVYVVKGLIWMGLVEPLHNLTLGELSWICVWIVAFPLFVPSRPGKILVSSLLAATMMPLAQLLTFWINGVSAPLRPYVPLILLWGAFPTYVCAVLSFFGGKVLYQLTSDVSRAREMGSYTLTKLLGKGGMGEVWGARHQMLARPAAIKLIRSESLGGSDAAKQATLIQRFEREAQATASLASPHAVELYDFGTTRDGTFYYVMELLDGLDLQTLVERFGPQPPSRVVHFLLQTCHALAEAHEKGLIHRDIKPANLYSCRFGRDYDFVKVLDFGLVKPLAAPEKGGTKLTQVGTVTGTPAYVAPEMVLEGEAVDGRADLYALACVAYWLLTGTNLFSGRGVVELLVQHARSLPEPPSKRLGTALPKGLEDLILKCLAKDPANRPQTADELKTELEELELAKDWPSWRARDWWAENMPERQDEKDDLTPKLGSRQLETETLQITAQGARIRLGAGSTELTKHD